MGSRTKTTASRRSSNGTRPKKPKRPHSRRAAKPKPPKLDVPMLRTSERSSFKRCRWQWERAYVDHLKPRVERPALRFGTLVHKALELRYPPGIKRGPKPAETFEQLYHEELQELETVWGFRDADDEWETALDIGVDMLEAFVEKYGRDEEWKVIKSEMTFQVPVYPPDWLIQKAGEADPMSLLAGIQADKPLFIYVGTMDGVWENRMDGGIRIIDWKTTKNDPTKVGHLILDEQTTAYWTWGVDWLEQQKVLSRQKQQRLDGMLFSFLRKAKRDDRPVDAHGHALNKDGSVSKVQPTPMFHRELVYRSGAEREAARRRAVLEFLDMRAVRDGEAEAYKTPGSPPNSHCNFCQYVDMCELHETGSDWESFRDASFIKWEPYAAHEIEEEGKAR